MSEDFSDANKRKPMLSECMRQIFEAEQGAELIGASRLARALAQRGTEFDDLVAAYVPADPPSGRRRRRKLA